MPNNDSNWQQQVWQQPPAQPQQPAPGQPAPAAGPQPSPGPGGPVPPQPVPPMSYAAPVPPQPQRRGRGWIVAIVVVVAVLALVLGGMWSCTSMVNSSMSGLWSAAGSASEDEALLLSDDAIGVIDISGTIQYDGSTASPEGLKAQLDRATENNHVKAVVLRIDSGGGTATAGEEMATYVRQFREDTGKPVVVSCASMTASAAYEIASQADYIVTAKTSAVGAIGTALQVTDLSELMDKLGINVENITSADSKDSSYGTRALTDEERAYYQKMVDDINATFIDTVATGRGMTADEVRTLATGLTYTGMEAVDNGLADAIGTREDAVAKAAELAGTASTETVSLNPDDSDLSNLLSLMSETDTDSAADAAAALKELEQHGTLAR